jgi:hypothetical protein
VAPAPGQSCQATIQTKATAVGFMATTTQTGGGEPVTRDELATLCLEPACCHVGMWAEAHRYRCPSHRPAVVAAACTCCDRVHP